MKELTIRVNVYGEYENTITAYADSEEDTMEAAREAVEVDYGTHEAWDEGEVSWMVDY